MASREWHGHACEREGVEVEDAGRHRERDGHRDDGRGAQASDPREVGGEERQHEQSKVEHPEGRIRRGARAKELGQLDRKASADRKRHDDRKLLAPPCGSGSFVHDELLPEAI